MFVVLKHEFCNNYKAIYVDQPVLFGFLRGGGGGSGGSGGGPIVMEHSHEFWNTICYSYNYRGPLVYPAAGPQTPAAGLGTRSG